ncbi:MAG TPA: hypothetical protein VNU70_13965, partial [Puia sp.]|nr:hypothetical protein [Puia sp.]
MMSLRRRGLIFLVLLQVLCLTAAARQEKDGPDGQRADTTVSDTVVVGDAGDGGIRRDSSEISTPDSTVQTVDSLLSRTVPDSVVEAWKKEPGMAYANDPRYWKTQREEDASSWLTRLLSSRGFSYLVYFVLGAILLYAIFRIVSENQLGAFYRRGTKKKEKKEEGTISGEEEDLDRQVQISLDNK